MRGLRSKGDEKEWMVYTVRGISFVTMALLVVSIYGAVNETGSEELVFSKRNYAPPTASRKLLTSNTTAVLEDYGGDQGDGSNENNNGDGSPNRIGAGAEASCSKDSILVFQGPTSPLPNGIPTYTVEIQNVCLSENCSISGIHLSCGWFSSARLINPSVFRRIDYDNCLVNDGQPLDPGESLSFQYANTFKYPLSVSSVSC